MIRVNQDDFEEWQAHPISEALRFALQKEAARIKEQWCDVSLIGGRNDPLELAEYRTRLRVYQEIASMTAAKLEEILNDEQS